MFSTSSGLAALNILLIAVTKKEPDPQHISTKSYSMLSSYKLVMQNIQNAIENVLKESDIKSSRINYIKQVFSTLLPLINSI